MMMVMAQEGNKIEMEILCKWNSNACPDRLDQKNLSTSKGYPFVAENFCFIHTY